MPLIGSFCLLFALVLSAYCFVVGIWALASGHPVASRLGETARRAGMATFIAVAVSALALVWAALNNDFSLAYILHHTNRDLPTAYKLAALWSGQEGSLLFWALLLSAYGFVLRLRYKVDPRLTAYASVVLAGIQVFFLALVNFGGNPFGVMDTVRADGLGLNPLLQYPEMVIHPPMLYLGYVGMSVPFAFGLAALIMKYPGEKWIHITRRWTMVAWLFLTCGIILGGHWAYGVLGWGGYWGWDPVEIASFLPWISATAFLHSVMMQEKRGMMKKWNVWLIFITFLLSIFGTLLTRSGLVQSVHAFAQSNIGVWFYIFLAVCFVVCGFFFIKNYSHLKSENTLDSLVSRESSFLLNNVVLLFACIAFLCGTLFPILTEWVKGYKISVGPPYFNALAVPIGLFLLFLTGVGPLLAWRMTSFASIRRNFAAPAVFAVVVAIVLIALGLRPWALGATGPFLHWDYLPSWLTRTLKPLAWVDSDYSFTLTALTLAAFVIGIIALEFYRGGRVLQHKLGTNLFGAMYWLTRRNTRRYGGYIVHFGVVVIMVGLAGATFNKDKEQEMGLGSKMQIGNYELIGQKYTEDDLPNYESQAAILDVYQHGKFLSTLYPALVVYKASQQPDHKVAIRSTLKEDLYVVYEGKNPDTDQPIIKAIVNPLVSWLWIGWLITVFGTLVALVPNAAQLKSPVSMPSLIQARPGERAFEPVGAAK
ncbi:MAG TPA: heme lyase CcmF/NrfE family subunit [Candidatus Angelobacter sp.]|nr:heme lyase CcmF/NrfE family subunit [Candidatus Angelobacter sp.]